MPTSAALPKRYVIVERWVLLLVREMLSLRTSIESDDLVIETDLFRRTTVICIRRVLFTMYYVTSFAKWPQIPTYEWVDI
jgi:hypothetical protein